MPQWTQKKAADPKTDGQCLRSIASYPRRRGVSHWPRRTHTPLRRAGHRHRHVPHIALFIGDTLVIALSVLRRLDLRSPVDRSITSTNASSEAPSIALHLFAVVGIGARVAWHGNWGAARHAGSDGGERYEESDKFGFHIDVFSFCCCCLRLCDPRST